MLGALRPEEPCDYLGGTCQAEGGKPSGSGWGARPSRPVGGAQGMEGEAACEAWRTDAPEGPGLEAPGRALALWGGAPEGPALLGRVGCPRQTPRCPRPSLAAGGSRDPWIGALGSVCRCGEGRPTGIPQGRALLLGIAHDQKVPNHRDSLRWCPHLAARQNLRGTPQARSSCSHPALPPNLPLQGQNPL